MWSLGPSRQDHQLALQVLASVASVGGRVAPQSGRFVTAVADALGLEVDVASPEAVDVASCRSGWSPAFRDTVVKAAIVTSCAGGEVTPPHLTLLTKVAEGLAIRSAWVTNLRRVVEGRCRSAIADAFWRTPLLRGIVARMWTEHGLEGLRELAIQMVLRRGTDAALAWRYKELGLLPHGTLGRAFWAHMTRGKLAFPGEHEGVVEPVLLHDLLHVLTGYAPDPKGEIQIAAFTAGYFGRRPLPEIEDPFAWIFLVLLAFHLGIRVAHVGQTRGAFDGAEFVHAFRRGATTSSDLTDYRSLLERSAEPLDGVRRSLGLDS